MCVLLHPHQNVLPLPFHLISSFSSFRPQRSLSFLPSSFLPLFSLSSFLPSAHSFSLSLKPPSSPLFLFLKNYVLQIHSTQFEQARKEKGFWRPRTFPVHRKFDSEPPRGRLWLTAAAARWPGE